MPLKEREKPFSKRQIELFFEIASPCLIDKVMPKTMTKEKTAELFRKYWNDALTAKDLQIFEEAFPGVLSKTKWHSKVSPLLGAKDPVITYFFRTHPENLQKEALNRKLREFCTPAPARIESRISENLFKVKTADGRILDAVIVKEILPTKDLTRGTEVFIHRGRIVSSPPAWVYDKAVKEYIKYLSKLSPKREKFARRGRMRLAEVEAPKEIVQNQKIADNLLSGKRNRWRWTKDGLEKIEIVDGKLRRWRVHRGGLVEVK